MESKTRLLDQMRAVLRLKHLSLRTEEAYVSWVKRFILFHDKRHPKDMGAAEIREFLTYLALHKHVAASTQNSALNAILFLYRHVLRQPFPQLDGIERAKRPQRRPTVLTRAEVHAVLSTMTGMPFLMASLLYGAGLRLMECVRLRVKDVDFSYHQITVRDGKGAQDRVTMLPQSLVEPLQRHLVKVEVVHEEDLLAGYGDVYLPYALDRKEPNAGKSWVWQYVFPVSKRSVDPRSGVERRHHVAESVLQKAVKDTMRGAHIPKCGSCHTLVVAEKTERQKGWAITAASCKIFCTTAICLRRALTSRVAAARSSAGSKAGLAYWLSFHGTPERYPSSSVMTPSGRCVQEVKPKGTLSQTSQ